MVGVAVRPQGGACIYFLIRKRANLAQAFTEIPKKEKEEKMPNCLTERPIFGPNFDSVHYVLAEKKVCSASVVKYS